MNCGIISVSYRNREYSGLCALRTGGYGMDINRLEEFVVLADCLNYSKAANLLFLTQPVLSRHINDLERDLGAQLFIRDTHKVALTPVGELAVHEIGGVVEAYHKAMRNIKVATDNLNGRISVGFLGQAVRPFITRFVRHMGSKPQVQIDYTSVAELDTLIHFVDTGAVDIGFVTHVETDRLHGVEIKWIMDDSLWVAVSQTHPLAGLERVSIRELSGKPIIVYDRDTNPHTAIFHEKLFQRFGAELSVIRKVRNVESGLFQANLGLGYFIIPQHLLYMAQDMAVIPISDENATISLHLIWKKSNTKTALQTFIKEFSRFYSSEFGE